MNNFMKKIIGILLIFIITGCSGSNEDLTIEPITQMPVTENPQQIYYSNLIEAMQNFDFESNPEQDLTAAQSQFKQGLQFITTGRYEEAESIFSTLRTNTADSALAHYSGKILIELLYLQSKWQDLVALDSTTEGGLDSNNTAALVKAYSQAPPEKIIFPENEVELPLELSLSGVPQIEVEVHGMKKNFWIDTGASYSVLAADFAEKCGIQPIGTEKALAGTSTDARVEIRPTIIDEMKIGDIVIKNHPAMIMNKSDLEFKLFGLIRILKIDGIIGWNAIRQMDLTLDYKGGKAIIASPVLSENEERNLLWLGYPILKPKNLSGTPLLFGFDNGANETCISPNIFSKIDTSGSTIETIAVGGAGGNLQKFKAATIPQVSFVLAQNRLTFKNINAIDKTDEVFFQFDGIIGSDIAQNGSIRLDFTNGRFDLTVAKEE